MFLYNNVNTLKRKNHLKINKTNSLDKNTTDTRLLSFEIYFQCNSILSRLALYKIYVRNCLQSS